MAEFRLYFCDSSDHIIARLEFYAPTDSAGLAIAAAVAEASNDRHCGYMVWRGKRLLYSSRQVNELQLRRFTRTRLTADQQEFVLRLEEDLLNSHWCIAHSVRLLEATRQLRDKCAKRAAARRARETQLAS